MKAVEQIKESVQKLYKVQQDKKKFDKYYEDVRKKEQLCISNWMFSNLKNGENSFTVKLDNGMDFYSNPVTVTVTKVRRKKITWDLEALKKKLSKEKFITVVNKEYTVIDMPGLVKYLKSCGVDPKKFKKFINVSETLDETKLDTMYETGKLKTEEIRGCYTVGVSEPYFRITEEKTI
jgi:hypothetical protein